jgi:uncharacterized membrane protein YqhA
MDQTFRKKLETIFEGVLWKGRLVTLLAVVFSFLSSLTLFLAGSKQIASALVTAIRHPARDTDYNNLLINIIGAVDLYLIAIVLLIFSFGVYELFISKIDQARHDKEINILEIKTLDDLKNRLLKVIIMALVVYFFKSILAIHFTQPLEMLYLGLAILAAAGSSIFIRKFD